ncbi:MAG: hypothetical protein ABI045_06820 [Flavobacteriales bacterium]
MPAFIQPLLGVILLTYFLMVYRTLIIRDGDPSMIRRELLGLIMIIALCFVPALLTIWYKMRRHDSSANSIDEAL